MSADLRGRVALVTGGNGGLGQATAIALASMGAHVVIACRDPARGAAAGEEIRARSGRDAVDVVPLDLARFDSVRACAGTVTDAYGALDVLVNNAGLVLRNRQETVDGFEATFQINHLSPFLLTGLLRDPLVAAGSARVVNVASVAHRSARRGLDFTDLQSTRRYRPYRAYARSKLANVLFTRELARRWAGLGVTVNAVNPGWVGSRFGLDGDLGPIASALVGLGRPFARSPRKGARTQVHLASAPEVDGMTGGYWANAAPGTPSRAARDDAAAARLWEISEALVGAP
ncbi:MAG: retinol dehydrogenase [Acidimicrobiia bacterium]